MPNRDGTGPAGAGMGTGRGVGGCATGPQSDRPSGFGAGRQHRAGRGGMQSRGFGPNGAGSLRRDPQAKAQTQQSQASQEAPDSNTEPSVVE